ncbi:ShlB/FhaC/HecB family hemolysin secretion/activation protein [Pasteurella oralis]|uniref:ShlB/FhaC/HecB family hemolysin secretion/activation protein n=1 Tax=Pasteurella oralis TaxID=1071947 RepID=UPI000C7E3A87|nr:ShlB/FhaC/HecB family hemolysin secretion/activation protein [Pasteurella oralis]
MRRHQYRKLNPFFWGCSTTILLVYSAIAHTNELNPLTQELLLLKNKQQFENVDANFKKAQQFLEDKQVAEENAFSHLDAATTAKHKITSISVDLASENISLDFGDVIQAYQGQPLSANVVFQLVKELTEVVYRSGYVTSAIGLKNTNIKNGDLEFVVLWGKVKEILVEGEKPKGFRDNAMVSVLPNLKDKVLRIYDIDQLVEILNTTNKTAKVNVVASEEKSISDLNIQRQRSFFPDLTLGFNNSGTESNANGRNQVTANVSWSDLFGTNDRWNFSTGYRLYKDKRANQQRNYALSYIQPFSFSTLELKVSESEYKKALQGIDTYFSEGKTQTATVKLSNTLLRNKETILSIYGELEFKKRLSYFADILIGNYHNYKANLGVSYVTNLGYGKLYSDISYSNGLRWFGADRSAYDSTREKTLRLFSGSINWYRPFSLFNHQMNYQMRIGAQYSFDSLYSENQFSIGDEYTVRGFKGSAASGDHGAYLSQTLTVPFYPQKVYLSQISPFLGFDIGKVHLKQTHKMDTLAGTALGVKAQVNRLALSLTYAKPLNHVRNVDARNSKPVYYFSGSVSF